MIAIGGSIPLLCLEGIPDLPGTPQDEAETQVSAPHASLWPEPLPVPPFPPTDRSLCSRTQVVLINAVKDVAKALGDLISATKAAAGKVGDDPAVWQLKNSAKVGGKESSCPGGE